MNIFFRALHHYKPLFFVMENVDNLARKKYVSENL
jgi:site-specific DNA-cytosine methylase